MDLYGIIHELIIERDRVDRLIDALEASKPSKQGKAAPKGKRRGRKSMGPVAREEVSARMKRYWAGRRQENGKVEKRRAEADGEALLAMPIGGPAQPGSMLVV